MPETFYSQEVIQQPQLASRAAYLHTAPPNYPAAAPYQPSPAHQAAPSYVSESATQTWPAIENPLPRDESAPELTPEQAAMLATAIAAGANKRRFSMSNIRMPKISMPKVSVPTMDQVKQSIPQVDTKKVGWKRIGVVSAALLALMLTIPTLYVVADRAPEAAPVESTEVAETNALKTLRDKVWNLATLGRGGVSNEAEMTVVALSAVPPVPGMEVNTLQAAYEASVAAADARVAAGQPALIGVAVDTPVRRVALTPLVNGDAVLASQRTVVVAVPAEQVAMSAAVVTNVEAVPLAPPCRITHTVRRGEGLFTIADAYGVERRQVYRANTWIRNRANMYLYVGDQVCIP
jgi:hypothetical protein